MSYKVYMLSTYSALLVVSWSEETSFACDSQYKSHENRLLHVTKSKWPATPLLLKFNKKRLEVF